MLKCSVLIAVKAVIESHLKIPLLSPEGLTLFRAGIGGSRDREN